jgi:hypothetical protein
MRLMTSILLALVLASCSNNTSTTIDAAPADAPHADGPGTDAMSAACTGKLYDACNPAASNCMTGLMCKNFTGSVFSVCTQTCGTCPNQGATTVMCNNMNICKPNAPNTDCTSP